MIWEIIKESVDSIWIDLMKHPFAKGFVIGLLVTIIIFCALAPFVMCLFGNGRAIFWYIISVPVGVGFGYVIDDIIW